MSQKINKCGACDEEGHLVILDDECLVRCRRGSKCKKAQYSKYLDVSRCCKTALHNLPEHAIKEWNKGLEGSETLKHLQNEEQIDVLKAVINYVFMVSDDIVSKEMIRRLETIGFDPRDQYRNPRQSTGDSSDL